MSTTDPVRSVIAEAVHVPLLVVLGGLPGTGKTTIARGLATHLTAVHLRVDTVEQALRRSPGAPEDLADLGYRVAYAVALDNLRLGHWVIADMVNPIGLARDAWRSVAEAAGAAVVEIEVVCSDPAEHERRVTGRVADIPGHALPTWQEVQALGYEPWEPPPVRVDTAAVPVAESVRQALGAIMRTRTAPAR